MADSRVYVVMGALEKVLLVTSLTLAIGCHPTQGYGPTLDEAVANPNPWPSCITARMKGRMAACPKRRVALATTRETAACANHHGTSSVAGVGDRAATWPPAATAAEPIALDIGKNKQIAAADRHYATGDYAAAERSYLRLLKRKAPTSGYVGYKLGRAHEQQNERADALAAFEAAARFAMDNPGSPKAGPIEAHSRRALIELSVSDDVRSAIRRFERIEGKRTDRTSAAMLTQLAATYARHGKRDEANATLTLLAETDAEHSCMHRANAVELERVHGSKATTTRALDALFDEFEALPLTPAREACGQRAAQLSLDIAGEWHGEALSTRDIHAMFLGSHVYRAILASFTQRDFDRWGICMPLADVAYGRAELLFAQQRWDACGPAFDIAISSDPRGARAEDAAFSAVVCRQSAWAEKKRVHNAMNTTERIMASLDHSDDWRQLLRSIHRYLCVANDTQRSTPHYAESAFARAQAFYDGGAMWEAAVAFRLVAFDHDTAASQLAAHRYAEVMEDLAVDDVCRRELTHDVQTLVSRYCGGGQLADGACHGMTSVLSRLQQHKPQL